MSGWVDASKQPTLANTTFRTAASPPELQLTVMRLVLGGAALEAHDDVAQFIRLDEAVRR